MNDPLNPESQARMMEMINQENVQVGKRAAGSNPPPNTHLPCR